jgi:hypothetical protein
MYRFVFLLALLAAAPVRADEIDVQQFKNTLEIKIAALGAYYSKEVSPDYKALANAFKALKKTDAYDDCVNPGWFTSKETIIKRCLGFLDEMKRRENSIKAPGRENDANIAKTEFDLVTYINHLPVEKRKSFATSVFLDLGKAREESKDYVNAAEKTAMGAMRSKCRGIKDLSDAVKCAIDGAIKVVEVDMPKASKERAPLLAKAIGDADARIRAYTEEAPPVPQPQPPTQLGDQKVEEDGGAPKQTPAPADVPNPGAGTNTGDAGAPPSEDGGTVNPAG